MPRARIVGFLLAGFLVHEARAQGLGPIPLGPTAPATSSVFRSNPPIFGRLGVSAGFTYDRRTGGGYGALLSGMYYLTPENRPLSFRAQGYAAWSPRQSFTARYLFPESAASVVSAGSSTQLGAGIAAILHARPRSRISPYLILSYGLAQRWQDGTDQPYDVGGQKLGSPIPWLRSHMQGERGLGLGLRARLGGQTIRLEVLDQNGRLTVSLGMSIPF